MYSILTVVVGVTFTTVIVIPIIKPVPVCNFKFSPLFLNDKIAESIYKPGKIICDETVMFGVICKVSIQEKNLTTNKTSSNCQRKKWGALFTKSLVTFRPLWLDSLFNRFVCQKKMEREVVITKIKIQYLFLLNFFKFLIIFNFFDFLKKRNCFSFLQKRDRWVC